MRKLEDLGILVPGTHLPEIQAIQAQTRPVLDATGMGDSDSPDAENGARDGLEQLSQG